MNDTKFALVIVIIVFVCGMTFFVLLLSGTIQTYEQGIQTQKQDCIKLDGIYQVNYQGSDACYRDGKAIKFYAP